jgi:hypothetical protein
MPEYDFYYTYEYHYTLAKSGQVPILIQYQSEEKTVLFPFLKRDVDGRCFDLISVHGYLGPISNSNDIDLSSFHSELMDLLRAENIVSVFSKLNPYLKGPIQLLKGLGQTEQVGELIYYDQTEDTTTQLSKYSRTTGQRLRKLRRIAYVREVASDQELDIFVSLYHKNLDRLKAKDLYYFPKAYFKSLINSEIVDAKAMFAIDKETEKIMGGAFCVGSRNVAQLEIVFTEEAYYNLSPVRLLYDECRELFRSSINFLNLGGGTGGREGSLMKFKASFTQFYADYIVWKLTVLPEVYDSLQSKRQRVIESSFFPKYRLPVNS